MDLYIIITEFKTKGVLKETTGFPGLPSNCWVRRLAAWARLLAASMQEADLSVATVCRITSKRQLLSAFHDGTYTDTDIYIHG